MDHKFSIVTPCYNCAATLAEAVDSVYRQGFREPFEIIAVDDGSKDGTPALLAKLAERHPEMKVIAHERNRGGGAARNTGIKESTGDLIFCLDSDNILGDGVLPKMAAFLDERRCDGVVFEQRKYFMHGRLDKHPLHRNAVTGAPIGLENLFDGSGTLLDNFLFTKSSWIAAGGYPENHGFDTQCFEYRYLAAGQQAFVCPGSVFYHRLSKNYDSYFQRVYQNGELSKNLYLIYEEVFFLLSPAVRRQILEFDIFRNTKLADHDLGSLVNGLYQKDPTAFFISDKDRYLKPGGFSAHLVAHPEAKIAEDAACIAIFHLKRGEYREAIGAFQDVVAAGLASPVVYFDVLRSFIGLSGQCRQAEIEDRCLMLVGSMVLSKKPIAPWKKIIFSVLDRFLFLKKLIGFNGKTKSR